MAELWYGHFDSTQEDPRKLMASDWASYIESFITSGIRNGGSNLRVIASNEPMSVQIEPGSANVRGYIMQVREDIYGPNHIVRIEEAHPSMPRIDRIVLRLDRRIAARYLRPVAIMGVAAHTPEPPPLTRTENEVYELSLAQVRVNAGARNITAANISDERFITSLCGVMNSVLGLDPSHWQAQFDDFFAAFTAASHERDDDFIRDQWDKFTEQIREQHKLFESWHSDMKLMVTALETLSFAEINNNFDDWSARRGCDKVTEFNTDGSITETIRIVAADFILATKNTEFDPDGSITETVRFHPWEFEVK